MKQDNYIVIIQHKKIYLLECSCGKRNIFSNWVKNHDKEIKGENMKKTHYNRGHRDMTVCGKSIDEVKSSRNFEKVDCQSCITKFNNSL